MSNEKLNKYNEKRKFSSTPEPKGNSSKNSDKPIFVIQKHNASNLHYDFRIEIDGVLKSWAIPKGPSTDPRKRRLAMPTEDHPMKYADFEGVIPKGNYGAGEVIVWDNGTYENLKENNSPTVEESLKEGHLTIWLNGKKLKGGYALIRTSKGKDERWILVKMKDDEADARRNPTSTENNSVLSGKTIEEVKDE
ncbi:DNA ligase [Clostridium sp. D2Q-11]|uniref:DNA ligase n=1 Tax=Anaeromonas frigoriresistens TaxID=2683708 RepID=A0A942UW09_9FIRM|nr:DNA polymerase ligase N-terminal domain-containing protein [Anaeromonas frigoriresistens]MBS4537451.1 DNA ligase [Anaeromonas frigoriresistens]